MRLLWPVALLLLAAVPLLGFRIFRDRSPALRFPGAAGFKGLPRSWRARLAFLPLALVLAAFALGAFALARPQIGLAREVTTGAGVDIVLALDISSSMQAEDLGGGTRLMAAKDVLADFVARRSGDRLGAVAFARNAVTVTPLTLDHQVLGARIDSVRIGDLPDGTAIGNAIAAAVNRLADSDAESRVIVLLTDGVSNAGEIHPRTAAGLAKSRDIRVYTVGAGSDGRSLRGLLATRQAPAIDEDALREVAEATGGRYFRARDRESFAEVYAEIDRLERTEIEEPSWATWADRGPVFAGWASILLFLAVGLEATAFRTVP